MLIVNTPLKFNDLFKLLFLSLLLNEYDHDDDDDDCKLPLENGNTMCVQHRSEITSSLPDMRGLLQMTRAVACLLTATRP